MCYASCCVPTFRYLTGYQNIIVACDACGEVMSASEEELIEYPNLKRITK